MHPANSRFTLLQHWPTCKRTEQGVFYFIVWIKADGSNIWPDWGNSQTYSCCNVFHTEVSPYLSPWWMVNECPYDFGCGWIKTFVLSYFVQLPDLNRDPHPLCCLMVSSLQLSFHVSDVSHSAISPVVLKVHRGGWWVVTSRVQRAKLWHSSLTINLTKMSLLNM